MGNAGVDEELVRSLPEQHADVAGLVLREVIAGWDNQMWRLGDDLAVRLPRTPRPPSLLRKEQEWLPVVAPRLPPLVLYRCGLVNRPPASRGHGRS